MKNYDHKKIDPPTLKLRSGEKKMTEYNHKKIESKWQKEWEKKKIYSALNNTKKNKFYGLIEFPYPSGEGLHVGHPRPYIGMDIISRKRRMEGYNVLYPIGWDAFGLPTENYAIKTGKDPRFVTKKNSDNFRKQIKSLGISFDWSREINTTDPKYYKWTQWIFLQFYKKGLAYKAKININWCPKDKIGLANEEVVDGCCERCGTPVEKREKEQWMLAITKYADRLDKDLDDVDYMEKIKIQQRNWIGKSKGSEIDFEIVASSDAFVQNPALERHHSQKHAESTFVKVFTTRADTLYGATYMVLAPEHELVNRLKSQISNWNEVEKYIKEIKNKTEIERTTDNKEKTGVELKGIKAINPAYGGTSPTNKEVYPAESGEIPVFIADYVLVNYGTGAIMAVPAHDERDYAFAKKYNLPIKEVVSEKSILFNSNNFDGLNSEIAREKITKAVGGKIVTKYKLRDWVFSRQRYWGEPIPMINCEKCGWQAVPDKDLPVLLPKVKKYQPTDSGESPLANITSWVKTKCPKCKGPAKRETDTMPNWAGSSWYYLRYTDPKNAKEFASKKALKYWAPVDWYNGGMEHTTLHLLYSRFWHKFLFDLKLVPGKEPYKKRTSHGLILGKGGVKMSKSLGNVVNPNEIVKTFGADTLRLYTMFMGPFEEHVAWSEESIIGPRRFIEKVWKILDLVLKKKNFSGLTLPGVPGGAYTIQNSSSLNRLLHKTIKKVGEDIENLRFNTAISALMILATEIQNFGGISKEDYKKFLQILSPFAPHVSEELWKALGEKKSITLSPWPKYDESLIKDEKIKIVVQVNGKVRGELMIDTNTEEEKVKEEAEKVESVKKHLNNITPKRVIYVKGRLINIVI